MVFISKGSWLFLNAVFIDKKILNENVLKQMIALKFPFKINSDSFAEYFGGGGDWMSPVGIEPRAGIYAYYYFFREISR